MADSDILYINNIQQVDSVKYLGIIMDCHLNWKYHVLRASKSIGVLIKQT